MDENHPDKMEGNLPTTGDSLSFRVEPREEQEPSSGQVIPSAGISPPDTPGGEPREEQEPSSGQVIPSAGISPPDTPGGEPREEQEPSSGQVIPSAGISQPDIPQRTESPIGNTLQYPP